LYENIYALIYWKYIGVIIATWGLVEEHVRRLLADLHTLCVCERESVCVHEREREFVYMIMFEWECVWGCIYSCVIQIHCSHDLNARARRGIHAAALGGFADVGNSQSTANCLGLQPQARDWWRLSSWLATQGLYLAACDPFLALHRCMYMSAIFMAKYPYTYI